LKILVIRILWFEIFTNEIRLFESNYRRRYKIISTSLYAKFQPSTTIITHSTLALIILFEDQKIGTINDAQELPNISAGIVKVNGSCAASDDFVTSLHDKKMPLRDL
jgi:hypothetical protein